MIKNARWFPFQEKDEDYEVVETKDYGKIPSSPFRKLRSIQTSAKEFRSAENIYKVNVIYRPKGVWYKKFEEQSQIRAKKDTIFTDLLMPSGGAILETGAPMLPTEGLFVALPPGTTFKELKIVNYVERKFPEPIDVLPAPKPTKDNGKDWVTPEFEPNEKIYSSDELFPENLVEIISTENKMGDVSIVHLMIYPMRYRPKSRELIAYSEIELDVYYTPAPKSGRRFRGGAGIGRTLPRRAPRQTVRKEIQSEILNLDSVNEDTAFDSDGEMGIMTDGGEFDEVIPEEFGPLSDLNNFGRYLIITKPDLIKALEPFIKLKEKDYSVKVVTDVEIYKEFGNKKDVAIRNFLRYAYDNWEDPPEFVLLVGDVNRIPTHHDPDYNCASDHYYACLTDSVYPDILVGRIAIDDATGLKRYFEKVLKFDKLTSKVKPKDWQLRVLLTAYNRWDYIECSNDCAEILESEKKAKVIKKYDGTASKQEIIKEINKGVGIINYRGHGDVDRWQSNNGLTLNDLDDLKNGDKTPIVFSIACLNAYIDNPTYKDCFGELFIEVKNGAVGFLGATRPSYTEPNHHFDRYLFQAIVEKDLKKVGEIFNWATMQLYKNFPDQYSRENISMYLWLGDPDLDINFLL
ncbi:MAG: C25 family cysteine peptidase [Candidatus Helarchaeota archaeon]